MAFKDQSTIPKATFIEIGVYAFLLNRCIHTFIEIGVYTRIAHLSLKVRLGQPCVELHNGAVLRLLPPFFFMTTILWIYAGNWVQLPPNQSHNAFQQKQRSSPAHAQTSQ